MEIMKLIPTGKAYLCVGGKIDVRKNMVRKLI